MSNRSYSNSSSSSIHSPNNYPHQRSPSTRTAPLPNDPQQPSKWSIQVSRKISNPHPPKFVLPPQPVQPLPFPDPDRCLIEAGYSLPPYAQDPYLHRPKNPMHNKPSFTPPPILNRPVSLASPNVSTSSSNSTSANQNLLSIPVLPSTITVSPIHTPFENPLARQGSLIRRKTQSLIEIPNRTTTLTSNLSTILTEFFKTSFEVMNGTQILDSIESICGIPKHRRDLTLAVSESILSYGYLRHVNDETFPIFDGEDEWYSVKPPAPDSEWPQSVLTYLTPCYFPTCCSSKPCGSNSCPTQIGNIIPDPQGKLGLSIQTETDDSFNIQRRTRSHTNPQSPSVASHVTLTPSQHDIRVVAAQYNPEQPLLWSQTVPPEILSTVESLERKRQEAIFETIINELAYINDLKLIDEIYVNPLRKSGIFNENRIDSVIATLFSNYKQILKQNESMMERFLLRQQDAYIVPFIGDLMLPWAKNLTCYSIYASNMLYAHHFYTNEAKFNPRFNQFLSEAAEHPKSRKLPIKHFIERPTGKLARYSLLLKEILKRTPEDSMDAQWLPQVVEFVKREMDQIDKVTGEVQLKLQLDSITSRLYFKKEDESPYLQLDSEHRKLMKQGPMVRHQGGSGSTSVVVFLFDNALVVAKEKNNTVVEYRGVGPAIPLYLLKLDDDAALRVSSSYSTKTIKHHVESASSTSEQGKALNLYFYGKYSGSHHLVAMNPRMRLQWAETINKTIDESPIVSCDVIQSLDLTPPSRPTNKPLHSTSIYVDPSTGASMVLAGSDDGLYLFDDEGNSRRVLWTSHKVVQAEVVLKYHLLLVLTGDKYLHAYSTDLLRSNLTGKKDTQPTKIGENVSFFKVGTCGSRDLVVSSKFHDLKSFFKAMELVSASKAGTLSKGISQGKVLWQSKHYTGLRLAKKFYVGTQAHSITFLKSKMAIACGPGFEIVDLDALFLNHGIPDPQDPYFVANTHHAARLEQATPLAIKRINPHEFLLCYKEFGLFVNNEGRCSRPRHPFIEWDGIPSQFSFVSNYVIAVDANLLEVRNLQTGQLIQVILEPGIRCTHPGTAAHIPMFVKEGIHKNLWNVQTIKMSNPLPDLTHF